MTAEKTDAQEREALAKIREILKDFDPEETYVGKAFDGCVELAEENIRNDWLYSWKGRYLYEQAKNCQLSDKLSASEEYRVNLMIELNQKDDAIARLEDAKNQLSEELGRMAGMLDRIADARAEISALRQTILELKAKLYDMMAGEEVEE